MSPVENLTPGQKRKLLTRLLEKKLLTIAPALIAEPDQSSGLDRFAVPVKDLMAEVVLDPSIRFSAPPIGVVNAPNSIFLTGATGFLGAFLLKSILDRTEANIYCLIRCSDTEQGRNRIYKNLETYLPEDGWHSARIIPVPGDLSRPLFGLSPRQFETLAATVDCVYHNAATVNGLHTYTQLKPTNVFGTQEAIRLASLVKLKPLHY